MRQHISSGAFFLADLLNSRAWWALKGRAPQVFARFRQKCKRAEVKIGKRKQWATINNGELVFTYREAAALGLSSGQFRDALDALIERGFLDIAERGSGLSRQATLYAISDRWQKWETPDFKKAQREKDARALGFADPKVQEKLRQRRREKAARSCRNQQRTKRKSLSKSTAKRFQSLSKVTAKKAEVPAT